MFTAAVVNPYHLGEYEYLVPLGRACQATKGMMGYHGYYYVNRGEEHLEVDWEYYAGRWTEVDKVLVANNVYVNWYSGESGAFESVEKGWKAPECLSADWPKYFSGLQRLDAKADVWNKQNQYRFWGYSIFTQGADYTGWRDYQVRTPEWRDIAIYIINKHGV